MSPEKVAMLAGQSSHADVSWRASAAGQPKGQWQILAVADVAG
jgi:hypothetical protein